MPRSTPENRRAYRAANRERINQRKREWYVANREKLCQKRREYTSKNYNRISGDESHPGKQQFVGPCNLGIVKPKSSRYAQANREKRAAYLRDYRVKNREVLYQRRREYREKNREYINAQLRQRRNRRHVKLNTVAV